MKIRRIISMILCLCLLTACGAPALSDSTNPSVNHVITKDNPDKVEIYNPGAFYDYGSTTYAIDTAALDEWTAYMNSVYPFSVVLHSDVPMNTSFNNINLDLQQGLAGMSASYMLTLIKAKKILPLDEYLKDNKVWNSLPAEYRETFEFEGHIWAIPNSGEAYQRVFSIRKDWLEAVNMEMPTNTAELLEVGRAFMRLDANKNGKADDYLLGGYPTAIFGPVFDAFGCYSNDDYSFIAYDPSMNCMVDNMFKPQAKEALQYIRTLYSEGLIDPLSATDPSTSYENMFDGEYGLVVSNVTGGKYYSGLNWVKKHAKEVLGHDFNETNDADLKYALGIFEALPPLSDEYTIPYQSRELGYVLAAVTDQPKQTINAFVDMVLGSKQSYMECYYGLPERYSFTSDNGVLLQYKDKATKTLYSMPRILYAQDVVFEKGYYMTYDKTNAIAMKQKTTYAAEYNDFVENYEKKYGKQFYEVPILYKPSGDTYISKYAYMGSEYRKLLMALSDETQTIDEILYDYQQYAILWSVVDLLKESNAALNLANKQVIE